MNPTRFTAAVLAAALSIDPVATALAACPQDQVDAYIRDLSQMSASGEASVRYLIPKFRECGQAVIASELDGSPEWLLAMRTHMQAQATQPAELKLAIDTALDHMQKAESSLQKNYQIVLQGIDAMYDNRFPPPCRRERQKIVDNMKATRPMVPDAITKLNAFKACLGI